MSESTPPPGSTGLPLLGETLPFLADGFAFVDERVRRHGPVFRTRILGADTVVITGTEGSTAWIDPAKIERDGSMPGHVAQLFGGRSLPLLDGAEHGVRKRLVLAGFSREALDAALAGLDATIATTLARWASVGEVAGVAEAKRLALEGICRVVLGLEPGPVTDALRADYGTVSKGITALPISLPGTAFRRALEARDRIFRTLENEIRRHRAEPGTDALSRILAAEVDGHAIGDREALLELHHVVIAGYIIFAELVAALIHLSRRPDLVEALRKEIATASPNGAPAPAALARMPLLLRVVMETKRLCPILPAVFGKAKTDFDIAGHRVRAGSKVFWGWWAALRDPNVFADAERFDPERFAPGRAEHQSHPQAYVPHGPGEPTGHQCPGTDFATLFMALFLVRLLRDTRWELPAQDLSYVWGKTPPEPKDGLRLVVREARAA